MKNILVPIDGSQPSLLALHKAKEIAEAFGSRITLLHVWEGDSGDYPSNPYKFSEEQNALAQQEHYKKMEAANKILEEGKARLSALSPKVTGELKVGNAAESIIDYVDGGDFDLVIMGSGGMKGLKHLVIGSVTRKVAINIGVPILIVK